MATRRKPPQKSGRFEFAESLADAADTFEERSPLPGDRVTVSNGSTVWTILSVSHSGNEVGLHVPNTKLERFRVPVSDLSFVDSPRPAKPKEPEKPKIDTEEVREHLASVHHSMIEHMQGEVAVLKKWLRSKGVSASQPLDEFADAAETSWKEAVDAIIGLLDDQG
jgi:hypothetical protein